MRRFTIDLDGPLHGADHGGEGTPIVLVHGLGGSLHNWDSIAAPLTAFGRVYALDLSGFGRTPPAGRGASVDANQRLVDRFVRSLDAGPAVLFGNSMGGMVSILQAGRHPDTVQRLALISPAAPAFDLRRVDLRWAALSLAYMVPALGGATLSAYERSRTPAQRVRESFQMVAADPDRLRVDLDAHVRMAEERRMQPWALPSFLDAYRSIVRYLPPFRYDRMVRAVNAPTLLVHGREDSIVPIVGSERIARIRPDWRFVPMDGVGHVAQMEAPAHVTAAFRTWISEGHPSAAR